MITMLGSPRRCCDGITRRETLQAGALSLLGGFGLPQLLHAESAHSGKRPGRAKSVICLFLLGGAATQDMFDLKPDAPADIRGEFKPISTSAPGVMICEHLPRMAKWMHKAAIVRSVNHKAGCHNCLPCYAGYEVPQPDQHPRDTHPPSMGSVCELLNQQRPSQAARRAGHDFPAYVYMPCWLGWGQVFRRAGPYAGFLGKRYDPLMTECAPYGDKDAAAPKAGYPRIVRGAPFLPDSALEGDLTIDRLNTRRTLLQQIDDQTRMAESGQTVKSYDRTQERAFGILTSPKMKAAFDLNREDPRVLDRYGRTLFGHSTLIARRLVESGVRFVNVTWDLFWDRTQIDYDAWDTHTRNFPIMRENKLPGLDQTYTALMEDLDDRGLLNETLIVVMSEMGRTPKINGNGGRDHWTYCYSVMLAGAGIRGGSVYGASDAQAAYVKDMPTSTSDICATIYDCLGIDPEMPVYDRSGRPHPVAQGGQVIREIVGSSHGRRIAAGMALFDNPPLRNFPDRAIRELLKNLSNLEELLTAAAPEQAACLDCQRAVLLDRGFVLEDWRERESDLLFRIPVRTTEPGPSALVCVLLEHQSASDPAIPLRLLVYAAMHWEREWKAWEDQHKRSVPLRLSPILPVVFHTGLTPWNHDLNLSGLIAAPEHFRQFAPHWPPVLFDLAERDPQQLLAASSKLLQAFAVVRAENDETPNFLTTFGEVLRHLEPLQDSDPVRWRDIMWFVLSWAVRRRPDEEQPALRTVIESSQSDGRHQAEIVAMTQRTWKNSEEQTLEKVQRAYQDSLKRFLRQRFATLPESVIQRIDATTDLEILQAAIDQAPHISKPEDLNL